MTSASLAGSSLPGRSVSVNPMDRWWDCEALDEMCCHAIRAGLEERFAFRLPNVWRLLTALLANKRRRNREADHPHALLAEDAMAPIPL